MPRPALEGSPSPRLPAGVSAAYPVVLVTRSGSTAPAPGGARLARHSRDRRGPRLHRHLPARCRRHAARRVCTDHDTENSDDTAEHLPARPRAAGSAMGPHAGRCAGTSRPGSCWSWLRPRRRCPAPRPGRRSRVRWSPCRSSCPRGNEAGPEHLPLGDLAQPDRIQLVGVGPVVSGRGQPAHAQIGSRSRCPWVTAGDRSFPLVLARKWHAVCRSLVSEVPDGTVRLTAPKAVGRHCS